MTLESGDERILGPGWEERRDVRDAERVRWERRSGQWAALDLARDVFGRETSVRLEGYGARGAFRGMITLRVPLRGLDDHRRREQVFRVLAGRDPVLAQVPLIFVFEFGAPAGSGTTSG